ncbi:DNA helicase [Actinomycetota bacterium]|nr:DNA helicase [Actinomycetota bacterium]
MPPETRTSATTLDVDVARVLSYPMAHNGVAFVGRVAVHHRGPAVAGASLQVEVRDVEGRLGPTWERLVDLAPDATTVLTDVDVHLDPQTMLQVEERRPARVDVRLIGDGVLLAERSVEVDLLAAQQWLAEPPVLALELLASFVQPNHPVITRLVSEAADLLAERTGDPSLQGYQAGPDRVDALVQAVVDAARGRGIRYSEPPASWSDVGQKVRTPQEVLDGRVGTCLDTTVVLAAALEQVGVRPLLWMVEGHAFLGYWRQELALDAIVQRDVRPVVNLVDLGLIGLVETTAVTSRAEGAPPLTLARLHTAVYDRWLAGDLGPVLGVVDVWRARRGGVLPLPARVRTEDGDVQVVEYRPAEHSPATPDAADPGAAATGTTTAVPVPARVRQWKNALLDLSLRNPLLHFRPRSAVSLAVPDGGLGRLEDALQDGRAVQLLPAEPRDEVTRARGVERGRDLPPEALTELFEQRRAVYTDLPAATYPTRLRAVAYKARTVVEETGANTLYLALGSLVWSLDGRDLRSPVVLVPVRLVTRSREHTYRLELDESAAAAPNLCLLEKLRQVHGLTVPGLADADGTGAAALDADAALLALRTALAAADLPFRVEETADLAVLQFTKFRLWKDLDESWSELLGSPLVRHLVETPTDPFTDPAGAGELPDVDLDELAAACPVPADASQLDAVAAAVAGRTFVLEGPPGTGKSQTITNVLTRAVAEGRRVLFVAEKRAALDVVRARLDEVGMGPFALDLHDRGSKPSAVRAQIRAALDHTVEADADGLAVEQQTARGARRTLARYAERLHEQNDAGLSFYSARTRLLALGTPGTGVADALPVPVGLLTSGGRQQLGAARRALELLPDVAEPTRPRPDHPWGFVGLRDARVDVRIVGGAVRAMDAAVHGALAAVGDGRAADALAAARDLEDLETLAHLAAGAWRPAPTDLDVIRTAGWQRDAGGAVADVAEFAAAPHAGLDQVLPEALDLDLDDLLARAEAAAASGLLGRHRRLTEVGAGLAPVLRPGTTVRARQVLPLVRALHECRSAARAVAARVAQVRGIALPADWNPLLADRRAELDAQIGWLRWAAEQLGRDVVVGAEPVSPPEFEAAARAWLGARADAAGVADGTAAVPGHGPDGLTLALDTARAEAWAELAHAAQDLSRTAQPAPGQVAGWAGTGGFVRRWTGTAVARDLDDPLELHRWVAFVAGLAPVRAAGLEEAWDLLLRGVVPAGSAAAALDRGIALASAKERRATTGLDVFDPVAHGRAVERFTTSAGAVRAHLRTAVAREVLDARTFDAAAGLGQVGALTRELARQRGGLGVRALMSTYGDLVMQAMPCVLVSPDSLARFFPARAGLFDIVVFDEASQIRVADAVGALGRARSAVVVGDSQQMPPTSFAELVGGGADVDGSGPLDDAVTDDGVALAVEDEESILTECVQARVPRHWLSWHYRSQDESLITFSNRHYYEDRLSTFPAPTTGTGADPGPGGYGVSLVRVDGTFHRSGASLRDVRAAGGPGAGAGLLRTNPVEAAAVVAEVRRRFDASPDRVPSIGVVTFNAPQRTLVEALLRDCGDERVADAVEQGGSAAVAGSATEGLFVKNLENVQGDERDTILFSTAFSVDGRGELPLNFGPLNRQGGHRRLNVAVTRARRQVVVFSSFDPEQLRAEDTTSLGVKHLRAYLDLAASRSRAVAPSARRTATVDRHREQVADGLRTRGWSVRTDVGLSEFRVDLVVSAPDDGRSVLAVLLDGPGWAARRTVGDRDGLPVQVLSGLLGWPAVERVWLPEWLASPGEVLDRLGARVEAVLAERSAASSGGSAVPVTTEPLTADVPAADPQPIAVGPDPAGVTAPRPAAPVWFRPWAPHPAGPRSTLDSLPSAGAAATVRAVVEEIVAAEAPVHTDRLVRLVATAFGLTRLTPARAAAILREVPADLLPDEPGADGTTEPFAWPRGLERRQWVAYRRAAPGTSRPVDEVPLRELANVVVVLAQASAGAHEDDLLRAVLAELGGTRLTAGVRGRLAAGLELAVREGRVRVGPDRVVVAG